MAKDKKSDDKNNPDGIQNDPPPPKPRDDDARIDLSEAETSGLIAQPTGSKLPGDTARIDLPTPGGPGEKVVESGTERIEDVESTAPKSRTARIQLESVRPSTETQQISAEEAKRKETSRINVEDSRGRPEPAVQPVREVPEKTVIPPREPPGDKKKRSTKRVSVGTDDVQDTAAPDPGKRDTEEIADAVDQTGSEKETVRVEVDEEVTKSETAKIVNEEKPAPKPSGTARIKVEEAEPAGDVFSRPQVTVEEKEGPSTLSRKPVSAPSDENRAPSDTDQAKRELAKAETDQIPGAEPATAPQPESAGELPAQSKTARIDVPAETVSSAGGRPKTIKIKRAERPDSTLSGGGRPRIEKSQRPVVSEQGEIGNLYTLLAAIAVIASLVLVYALAAQTVAVGMKLPFPGTIGG